MRVDEWLRQAMTRLDLAGVEAPRTEAQVLAAHAMRADRSWLLAHPDAAIDLDAADALLERREAQEPLAYITGIREFYGRPFGVDRNVLIPRADTETLVEAALREARPTAAVLDFGTGSGVIAVTLKLERPDWEVTAIDISPEALAIASANARFHHAEISFIHSDGFSGLLGESYDLIVSNPPYIAESETLPAEVLNHEPSVALFSGPTGLEFYDRLAREAPSHLRDGGTLMVEVGHTQAAAVRAAFEAQGWLHQETINDLPGIPRVVVVTYPFDCARA